MVRRLSLTRTGAVATTASPPSNTPHPTPNHRGNETERDLPGEEWIDQIREAIKGKVYTDDQVKDIQTILK